MLLRRHGELNVAINVLRISSSPGSSRAVGAPVVDYL